MVSRVRAKLEDDRVKGDVSRATIAMGSVEIGPNETFVSCEIHEYAIALFAGQEGVDVDGLWLGLAEGLALGVSRALRERAGLGLVRIA